MQLLLPLTSKPVYLLLLPLSEHPQSKIYTFNTLHFGEFLKKRPTNAPIIYLFSIFLHVAVVSFEHHQGDRH